MLKVCQQMWNENSGCNYRVQDCEWQLLIRSTSKAYSIASTKANPSWLYAVKTFKHQSSMYATSCAQKKQNRQAKSMVFQVLSGKAWSTVLGVRCCQARSQKAVVQTGPTWKDIESLSQTQRVDSTKRIHNVLDNQLSIIMHLYNIVQSYKVVYWIRATTHSLPNSPRTSFPWLNTNKFYLSSVGF